jgi:hypothetical protein
VDQRAAFAGVEREVANVEVAAGRRADSGRRLRRGDERLEGGWEREPGDDVGGLVGRARVALAENAPLRRHGLGEQPLQPIVERALDRRQLLHGERAVRRVVGILAVAG